jgi:ABC-type branched-subunit amino acid transport system ATPase component
VANDALLSVRGITVRFGGVVALDSVSFDVPHGGVCGLIGPNGAGKTTLFNCLSRLYSYQAGDIQFEGKSITATRQCTRSLRWAWAAPSRTWRCSARCRCATT